MQQSDRLNTQVVIDACSKGSHLILNIDRATALDILVEIRKIYGTGGGFINVFKDGVSHLLFERRLPNLPDLMRNDSRFTSYVDHEGRIFLSKK